MNSGVNALGQGNRANATIGRALQLVVRNVGGGRPGEIDRATLGNPGKFTFCFAEREQDSPFAPLAADRGVTGDAVTLFAASGVQPVVDQLNRDPESLARTFAACLRVNGPPKLPMARVDSLKTRAKGARDSSTDARVERAYRTARMSPGRPGDGTDDEPAAGCDHGHRDPVRAGEQDR